MKSILSIILASFFLISCRSFETKSILIISEVDYHPNKRESFTDVLRVMLTDRRKQIQVRFKFVEDIQGAISDISLNDRYDFFIGISDKTKSRESFHNKSALEKNEVSDLVTYERLLKRGDIDVANDFLERFFHREPKNLKEVYLASLSIAYLYNCNKDYRYKEIMKKAFVKLDHAFQVIMSKRMSLKMDQVKLCVGDDIESVMCSQTIEDYTRSLHGIRDKIVGFHPSNQLLLNMNSVENLHVAKKIYSDLDL